MRCRHQERLWKEYLRDPSLWWDFRKTKTSPGAPDFKHKYTQELLWLQCTENASQITENRAILSATEQNSATQRAPISGEEGKKEKEGFAKKKIVSSIGDAEKKFTEVPTSRYIKENEDGEVLTSRDIKENEDGHVQKKKKLHSINFVSLSLPEIITALEADLLLPPSRADMSCILRKCKNEKEPMHVLRLHEFAQKKGWEAQELIGNQLVSTLADSGSMDAAQSILDTLSYRSASSWNAMLMGYIKCGKPENALSLYHMMQKDHAVSLDGALFVALIKVCANLKDTKNGCNLHAELARTGMLERDPFVGSSLLDMYVECGYVAKAEEVFKDLKVRDAVVWNALLGGYIKWGHSKKALDFFRQMQVEEILPDAVTFVFALKACRSMGASDKGQEVHAEVERKGLLERDLFVASVLVDMYAKCGLLTKAREVIDRLPARDVVCWTALIMGYAEHGHGEECLEFLEKMKQEDISPNVVTLICCLKACGSLAAIDKATEIHAEIERRGLLVKEQLLGSTLVDMYAKAGSLVRAQETFNTLPAQNVVAWTALISGYIELGHFEEALNCFERMQANSVSPDAISFIFGLKACGSLGATDKGFEIHAQIERQGLLKTDLAVGNALVDMYARCGSLAIAHRVFDALPVQGIVAWNSLIAGYAQIGESESVFGLFDRMLEDGMKPDLITFVIVLDVCSQVGLHSKGEAYFKAMSKEYKISPVLEHHTCMLDLLGRAGLLEKAVALIKKLPISPDLAVWHAVLGACRKWGNVTLGREAFEHSVHLDKKDGASYVMMSSIYANANMKEEAKNIMAMRVEKQASNRTGFHLQAQKMRR